MAISNIIGTIGTIMPLRASSGLSSIAPAGSRENTAPPSTPVLVNLSGLPANTPENVKRLTQRIVQVQERLDYILKVYVIGMNNIAATQMYVALDILEPSPLYRHNLKRFVKEAIALHEKYQGKLRLLHTHGKAFHPPHHEATGNSNEHRKRFTPAEPSHPRKHGDG